MNRLLLFFLMSNESIQPKEINFLCENHQPIQVSFKEFFAHSELLTQQAWSGKVEKKIDYKSKYEYDSILQFSKACVDEEPKMTPENVFGYYSLCEEWKVDQKVFKYASDFLQKNGQKLLINHLLFQLEHDKENADELKEKLKNNLPNYIDDPNLPLLPFDVLKEVVDFAIVEKDQESFQKVYSFCLKYFDDHPDNQNCSELFSTLNTGNLPYEDLSRLTGKKKFDRTKLNDSLGSVLAELINRTAEMPKMIEVIQSKYKEDIEKMEEREQLFNKDQQESQLLRKELLEEKKKVEQLTKKVDEIKDSIFPFLKKTQQYHEEFLKEKAEREKKEKEEKQRKLKELEDKKVAVPVYYPDWSNISNTSWSNGSAKEDGWMCVQTGCCDYSSPASVTVAGKKQFIVSGNSSSYTYSSVFFPVRKGQSLSYRKNSLTSQASYFIKNKGGKIVTLPDWSNACLKNWFQNYNAECDGWIYADCGSNGNQGYLQICDNLQIYICQQNSGYQSYSSVLVPISSNEKYYFYHGGYPGVCYFIPGKKDDQVGMPDWDKEQGRSWNQKYEASEKGWVYAQCQSYYCQYTSSNNSPGFLMVNGIPIVITHNDNSSYYDNASVFIPVAKGDKYNACGGYANQSISFFPCCTK